jgi:hypothetical protein
MKRQVYRTQSPQRAGETRQTTVIVTSMLLFSAFEYGQV